MVRRTRNRRGARGRSRNNLLRDTRRVVRKVSRPIYRNVRRINKPIQRETGKVMHKAVRKSARALNRLPGLTFKDGRRRRRRRTMRGGGIIGMLLGGMGLKKVLGRDPNAPPKKKPFSVNNDSSEVHVHMAPGQTLGALAGAETNATTGGSRRSRRSRRARRSRR